MRSSLNTPRTWPALPWDDGITWFSRRIVEPDDLPMDVSYLYDQFLRGGDLSSEFESVEAMLRAATQAAEDDTQRALMPQTWQMVLSGFPASGRIVLERPPFIEVVSLSYYETDGTSSELVVSPAEFQIAPSGAYSKAVLTPLDGQSWPSAGTRSDAVTITYRAGYEDTADQVLQLINAGIGLMVGEMYKLRSLSVHAVHNTPSALDLKRFWRPVSRL